MDLCDLMCGKPLSQADLVYQYLRDNGSITAIEAEEEFGIYNISDVIRRLKKQGIPIHTELTRVTLKNGMQTNRARYSLEE